MKKEATLHHIEEVASTILDNDPTTIAEALTQADNRVIARDIAGIAQVAPESNHLFTQAKRLVENVLEQVQDTVEIPISTDEELSPQELVEEIAEITTELIKRELDQQSSIATDEEMNRLISQNSDLLDQLQKWEQDDPDKAELYRIVKEQQNQLADMHMQLESSDQMIIHQRRTIESESLKVADRDRKLAGIKIEGTRQIGRELGVRVSVGVAAVRMLFIRTQ